MVAAAFLHDTLEDTSYTEAEMREEFGDEVTDLVVGMTNISKKFPCLSRKERKEMDRNRLALSPIEVKIIKSCDRADNLDDMRGAPFDFQKLYLGESYELYGCIKGGDEVSDNLLSQALSRASVYTLNSLNASNQREM
jgi:(p)ppGpp synthase/HD superfamily hydrolase